MLFRSTGAGGGSITTYGQSIYSLTTLGAPYEGAVSIDSTSFTNLTIGAPTASGYYTTVTLSGNITVSGTLTANGSNGNQRIWFKSNTVGTSRTITAANISFTDVDFTDITAAGTASPFTGTRLGNAVNNSNITFPAPKTDRKSTRLNSSHIPLSRMPSSA